MRVPFRHYQYCGIGCGCGKPKLDDPIKSSSQGKFGETQSTTWKKAVKTLNPKYSISSFEYSSLSRPKLRKDNRDTAKQKIVSGQQNVILDSVLSAADATSAIDCGARRNRVVPSLTDLTVETIAASCDHGLLRDVSFRGVGIGYDTTVHFVDMLKWDIASILTDGWGIRMVI